MNVLVIGSIIGLTKSGHSWKGLPLLYPKVISSRRLVAEPTHLFYGWKLVVFSYFSEILHKNAGSAGSLSPLPPFAFLIQIVNSLNPLSFRK
ncbi:hypothetical protein EXU85_26785 [Spirosoma sp. KCTC 42546]|uniref:hypothetical protein n=1 Tax=Spirosoma sp. KCTC 42546 TaxID=2520506 RepID=UPI0011585269|nr:hypothetical protein [Spirosoma sp. KCTC 42546]QDK82016.1 hypothetical protein EXU85_26785 [Spirosoma sp. KCTC 42546]